MRKTTTILTTTAAVFAFASLIGVSAPFGGAEAQMVNGPEVTWRVSLWGSFEAALDAQIALGIALVADHADGGFMNEVDIGAKLPGDADRLGIAAGVVVEKNRFGISHD